MTPRETNAILGKRLGFTLLEIMLALLIIMIGVVAMSGLLGSSLDTAAKSHDDLTVVGFADLVLNYCNTLEFDQLEAGLFDVPDSNGDPINLRIGSIEQYKTIDGEIISYRLNRKTTANVVALSLEVWPGPTTTQPRLFYTEIYNWKKTGNAAN